MPTQALELDSDKSGHATRQVVNLTEGTYELKFDYAPKRTQPSH